MSSRVGRLKSRGAPHTPSLGNPGGVPGVGLPAPTSVPRPSPLPVQRAMQEHFASHFDTQPTRPRPSLPKTPGMPRQPSLRGIPRLGSRY